MADEDGRGAAEEAGAEARIAEIETRETDVGAPPEPVVRRGATFESFRYRSYTLFWSGALVSNTGTWMQNYALGLVVFAFRRSELDLGIVNFVSGVPTLVLALFAGVLADRLDRRRLIISSQVVLLAQAGALGYLYTAGRLSGERPLVSLAWVAALGLVGGIVTALSFPAWQAILPDLVPRGSLLNAIALNSAQFQSARLLGPLVAGALVLAGARMGDIFYVNAASFLFVIAALIAVRLRPSEDTRRTVHAAAERDGAWRTLTAGLRYARENPIVGWLIATTAVLSVFGLPYMMLLAAIVDKSLGFHVGTPGYASVTSYIMSANGLGAVCGALIVAGLPKKTGRGRIIPFSLLGMSVLLVGFGLSRTLWLSMPLSLLAGAAVLTTNSISNTLIQNAAPGHLRGRVMALFIMAFMGLMPVSSLLFGAIGDAIGPSNAVLVGAVVLMSWSLLLLTRLRWLAAADENAPPR